MNEPQPIEIEFTEELRGKNALNFWAGVAIIAGALYAWAKGWFSIFAFDSGIVAPPESGYGSGFATLAIDTVCLVGLGGIAFGKLCYRFALGIAERFSLVANGVYVWAARSETQPPQPTADSPPESDGRLVDAVRNIETRLRNVEAYLPEIQANEEATETE